MELPVTLHETGTAVLHSSHRSCGDSGLVLALKNWVLEGGGIGIGGSRYLAESELVGQVTWIEVLP